MLLESYCTPSALCYCAAGVGEYFVNGLQVCNLKPVARAPAATCVAAGGTCTALSADDIVASFHYPWKSKEH
jgi:hypothetical protein